MKDNKIDVRAAYSVLYAIVPFIDMLTALSLLYLYHILGLKKRILMKADSRYTIDALVNASAPIEDNWDNIKKEESNKLT